MRTAEPRRRRRSRGSPRRPRCDPCGGDVPAEELVGHPGRGVVVALAPDGTGCPGRRSPGRRRARRRGPHGDERGSRRRRPAAHRGARQARRDAARARPTTDTPNHTRVLAEEGPGGDDGGVAMAYRLRAGDTGPVQQSPVTCGSACLTVARMLVDPVFARWVAHRRAPAAPGCPAGRDRGRALRGLRAGRDAAAPTACSPAAGRLNLPWPRPARHPAVGRPRELEFGASRRGTSYSSTSCGPTRGRAARRAFDAPRRRRRRRRAGPALRRQRRAAPPRRRSCCPATATGCSTSTTPAPGGSTTSTRHRRRAPAAAQRLGRPVGRVRPTGLRTSGRRRRRPRPRPTPDDSAAAVRSAPACRLAASRDPRAVCRDHALLAVASEPVGGALRRWAWPRG